MLQIRNTPKYGQQNQIKMSLKILKNPTPWEALVLVVHYLDPKTLAIASCVSKSWSLAMSSDQVWQPICSSRFTSLSNLKLSYPSVPYHRLFAIGLAASKRRLKPPSKPRLSLEDLVFAIELSSFSARAAPLINIAEPASKIIINVPGSGVFKFAIDVNGELCPGIKASEEIKITWNVVLKGWEAAFTMMDCQGKLSCTTAAGWFSEELPSPGYCSGDVGSGIVADVKVGFCGKGAGNLLKVEKVCVGMLRRVDWRYVSVVDGLRYLQHFLLLCDHK